MKKWTRLLAALLVLVMAAGCGAKTDPSNGDTPGSTPKTDGDTPVQVSPPAGLAVTAVEDTVTVAMVSEAAELDPQGNPTQPDAIINVQVYEGLVRMNNDTNKIEPWLAESWEQMDDETLRVKLREGVMWQDGTELHANRCDDIAFAVRLSWEFGFRCVIVHGADALLAADLLRESDIPVLAGSILLTPDSYETRNMDMDLPAGLERAGVRFALTTDHHLSPIQSLSVAAALAVRDGLREDRALEAVTLEPAKLLGVDGRIGSLRAGKDADFVIWSGSPFSYRSRVQKVFIRGKLEAEF